MEVTTQEVRFNEWLNGLTYDQNKQLRRILEEKNSMSKQHIYNVFKERSLPSEAARQTIIEFAGLPVIFAKKIKVSHQTIY
jgi:hypothetical protein